MNKYHVEVCKILGITIIFIACLALGYSGIASSLLGFVTVSGLFHPAH